jgi:hypothetical protein
LADPPTMKPMKSKTFPKMMNHRRPKRSELAPQTLRERLTNTLVPKRSDPTYMKAIVTVMV